MVWAAMNSSGQVIVRRCPERVNAASYQELLKTALPFIKGKGKLFQQDDAPPHTVKPTSKWLNTNSVTPFNSGKWPPQSPGMNPIEHLWPIVNRKSVGQGQSFSSKDALWARLDVWFLSIPAQSVKHLYASMARRMAAVMILYTSRPQLG